MKAGDVFLAGNYAELLAPGVTDLPDEAKEGPYALGAMIMVCRESMVESYRLPDLPLWFPARVCLPPPVDGQWYRWYDPFVWFETEGPIHTPTEAAPDNMSYVGNLWHPTYKPDADDKWAYPVAEWQRIFGNANEEASQP